MAYGFNPLTGAESPAGRWRVRNVVTWARPNPPVGALGDKWRPATSDVVVACLSGKRYWDDLATRKVNNPHRIHETDGGQKRETSRVAVGLSSGSNMDGTGIVQNPSGAPLLDYWEIPPGGYKGAHYAVFPPALVEPLVKAMCPEKVCRECGEPSGRITSQDRVLYGSGSQDEDTTARQIAAHGRSLNNFAAHGDTSYGTLGWTCCGCCLSSEWDEGPNGRFLNRENCANDHWRPGLVLDPFAGSGTTLEVAVKWGMDAIGFDIDERNADLARERVGVSLFHQFEGGSV